MDPRQQRQMMEMLHAMAARGYTVLLRSHILEELNDLAASVLVMAAGRLAARVPRVTTGAVSTHTVWTMGPVILLGGLGTGIRWLRRYEMAERSNCTLPNRGFRGTTGAIFTDQTLGELQLTSYRAIGLALTMSACVLRAQGSGKVDGWTIALRTIADSEGVTSRMPVVNHVYIIDHQVRSERVQEKLDNLDPEVDFAIRITDDTAQRSSMSTHDEHVRGGLGGTGYRQ
jgi:hypothetical protein